MSFINDMNTHILYKSTVTTIFIPSQATQRNIKGSRKGSLAAQKILHFISMFPQMTIMVLEVTLHHHIVSYVMTLTTTTKHSLLLHNRSASDSLSCCTQQPNQATQGVDILILLV